MNPFQVPLVRGTVSSVFGPRTHPETKEPGTFHNGVDFQAPVGEPVLAAREGVIEAVNHDSPTGGKVVYIRHPDGTQTRYMHLSAILVDKVGLKVFARQAIGLVGNTGRSTGPHLHFEVRDKDGKAVDPGPLIGVYEITAGQVVKNTSLAAAALVLVAVFIGGFFFWRA